MVNRAKNSLRHATDEKFFTLIPVEVKFIQKAFFDKQFITA